MKISHILSIVFSGLILAALAWYGQAVFLRDPLEGKEAYLGKVREALDLMAVEEATWKTEVIAVTRETDVARERLWARWADLERWPEWSKPLHIATRWLDTPGWRQGVRFEQTLDLGFPAGRTVSLETVWEVTPGKSAIWWKSAGGTKASHFWMFESLHGGRTRVTNVEVFHGSVVGYLKPFVGERWQRLFESSVDGLIRSAAKGD
jgi:uncharacterized membrane protein